MPSKTLTSLSAAALTAAALVTAAPAEAGAGDWLVRGRAIAVIPDEGASVAPLGGSVEIDDAYVPEVDFSYFLTDAIALELIAATAPHDVKATAAGGIDLGSVWLLPPTLLLQYHFNSTSRFTPYVGAGVNYTVFYNVDEPAGLTIDYDDAFGWALQAGADIALTERWVFNIDVKKIFLSTDVSINGGAITADVDIDPWVAGVGFGYRF